MKYCIFFGLTLFLISTSIFARCNGRYANSYIEDIFDLGEGALGKSDAQSQELVKKLTTGNLGTAVGEICMSGCYLPSSDEEIKLCEKKYRIAIQQNIAEAELVLNKKANRSKFIGYCEYSADVSPTNFNARSYANETNKSCSSSGCLPDNITLCRSTAICNNHPQYGSESYSVSCVGNDGECPSIDECMSDTFTQPQNELKKSDMNLKTSKSSQQ